MAPPTFAFGKFAMMSVTSFDGTTIHVDLQFPEEKACPCPALITYTPYSMLGEDANAGATQLGAVSSYAAQFADEYVPHGYVVGVAHVRGTGESGGCLTVGGPEEGRDGYALVESLANQSWSNGKVALAGTSWDGTTPLETAVLQPPHLAAIVAISPVTSWYTYYFEHGAHRRNGDTFPGSSDTDPAFDFVLGGTPGPRTMTVQPNKLDCVAEFTQEDDLQDDYDAYWDARNHGKNAGNITAPLLYAQGWNDENVATTMIPDFWSRLTGPRHAWLEQHKHGVPASKTGFYTYMHQFLDHYEQGVDNGAQDAPLVVVEDNLGKFRTEATWPPADTHSFRLYLTPDLQLLPIEGSAAGSATWTDLGLGYESAASGIVGQQEGDTIGPTTSGVDHVEFTSPVLAGQHVAGVATLHLVLSTDQPDTQVDVLLYDESANGQEHFLTRGYVDLAHRDSLTSADPPQAGTDYAFTMPLHPRDYRVHEGDSLRLVVKSTDDYVVRSPYRATNTIQLGHAQAWLELPLIDDALRTYSDKAPAI